MLSGISHAHSTYSFDGKEKLADLQAFLTKASIDFCLMSEHVESLDYELIRRMLEDYDGLPSQGCLMIPGIEIDDLHILLYGVTGISPYSNVEDLARQMFDRGALIFVSHPIKVRARLPELIMPWLTGVEIWNTRYDGRRNPRRKNLVLWKGLERLRGPLRPLVGVDLHSVRDLSQVRIELDCQKQTASIIDSIRGGHYRLRSGSHEINLDPANARGIFWTGLFDLAVATNRIVKKAPFRIPHSIRRAVKRFT